MTKVRNLSRAAGSQQGVALIMAMVILVILTMLGISAIKSSSLQLKMATGLQDNSMAFQAAESGLVEAYRTIVLDPNQTITSSFSPTSGIIATVETTYKGRSEVTGTNKPSSKVNYRYSNFEQTATATTAGGAKVVINQGVRQLINK